MKLILLLLMMFNQLHARAEICRDAVDTILADGESVHDHFSLQTLVISQHYAPDPRFASFDQHNAPIWNLHQGDRESPFIIEIVPNSGGVLIHYPSNSLGWNSLYGPRPDAHYFNPMMLPYLWGKEVAMMLGFRVVDGNKFYHPNMKDLSLAYKRIDDYFIRKKRGRFPWRYQTQKDTVTVSLTSGQLVNYVRIVAPPKDPIFLHDIGAHTNVVHIPPPVFAQTRVILNAWVRALKYLETQLPPGYNYRETTFELYHYLIDFCSWIEDALTGEVMLSFTILKWIKENKVDLDRQITVFPRNFIQEYDEPPKPNPGPFWDEVVGDNNKWLLSYLIKLINAHDDNIRPIKKHDTPLFANIRDTLESIWNEMSGHFDKKHPEYYLVGKVKSYMDENNWFVTKADQAAREVFVREEWPKIQRDPFQYFDDYITGLQRDAAAALTQK